VVGKRPLDKGGKGGGTGAFGRGSEAGEYHGKELGASGRREFAVKRVLGEVAGERVLPALQGGGVCAAGMVARQPAPGCTRCVGMEKGSALTKRARAEAPRTGVYVISAWNVRGTGRTGCNRAQGSFVADGVGAGVVIG